METSAAIDTPTIKPINKGVVHRICAGQVILDLSSAVKELVENSLDAGATSIEIALKDYGEESFQVIDNGCGISPNNYKVLALKHHTSKLEDFHDLQCLTTFGFRGEALSSLCALGNLTVETRTKNESVATHLTFDHSGLLKAEKKTARQIGTTVTVKKLFSSLPVRSKEFSRNIRKEYGKLVSLLNAYALIAGGVRFVCTNSIGKNAKSIVLNTQGRGSLKDNIITVFGMKTFTCLQPITVCISDDCKVEGFLSKPGQGSGRNLGDRQYFFVNGRPVDLPKVNKLVNELYRGANSRQYPIAIMNFTVPGKACDVNVTPDKRKVFFADESSILHSLREGLQETYSSSNATYSVNTVEEDYEEKDSGIFLFPRDKSSFQKTQFSSDDSSPKTPTEEQPGNINSPASAPGVDAQFSGEESKHDSILKKFRFDIRAHGIKKRDDTVSGLNDRPLIPRLDKTSDQSALYSRSPVEKIVAGNRDSSSRSCCVQSSLKSFITVNKRKHENTSDVLSEMPVLRKQILNLHTGEMISEVHTSTSRLPSTFHQVDDTNERREDDASRILSPPMGFKDIEEEGHDKLPEPEAPTTEDSNIKISILKDNSCASPPLPCIPPVLDSPVPSSGPKLCSTLQFSFKDLKMRRLERRSRLRSNRYRSGSTTALRPRKCFAAATLELSQPENEERKERALAAATTELERFFRKEEFKRMQVIGQFNLGFIIAKLDEDLFIVDQHAADEKFNFERLARLTVLNQQPLLRPLRLELAPEEEVTISMHRDIIRKNGFILEEDPNAPPGRQFMLRAVPFSKNITFGVDDFKDLIATLGDNHGDCSTISSYKMGTADSVCPSRVRAMLASRACRSSIMIGDSLGKGEMQKILEHLAELESPWNCPHGRPTMRHLVDLSTLHRIV